MTIRVHAETSLHHVCKFAQHYVILRSEATKNLCYVTLDPSVAEERSLSMTDRGITCWQNESLPFVNQEAQKTRVLKRRLSG